jgi:hypothetical protein
VQDGEDAQLAHLLGPSGLLVTHEAFGLHFACRNWQQQAYKDCCMALDGQTLLLHFDYQEHRYR